ncbi:MAG: ornithine carbamoyltransferase [Deltaproteobacteria bacterium]|nr:MAG: ornithine carbamoyltransferase [Deltaproteobacteria bacterium]
MKKDLLSLGDFTKDELFYFIERAFFLKKRFKENIVDRPFESKTMALIFDKASTRTRVSFETAFAQLGGHPMFLSSGATQMSRSEPLKDTARVLERYVDIIVIRTYGQDMVEEFARWSSIPVINALTDMFHPCQIMSDLMTVAEYKGGMENFSNLKFVWIGDGNNVANSWINAAKIFGFSLSLAIPEGYEPDKKILESAMEVNPDIKIERDPFKAAENADILYTDVWASMGQEDEQAERERFFKNFIVDKELLSRASKDCCVMHCLPAHRGEEVTDEVLEGSQSIIFDEAENKLHMHKALLDIFITNNISK